MNQKMELLPSYKRGATLSKKTTLKRSGKTLQLHGQYRKTSDHITFVEVYTLPLWCLNPLPPHLVSKIQDKGNFNVH